MSLDDAQQKIVTFFRNAGCQIRIRERDILIWTNHRRLSVYKPPMGNHRVAYHATGFSGDDPASADYYAGRVILDYREALAYLKG